MTFNLPLKNLYMNVYSSFKNIDINAKVKNRTSAK